MKTRFIFVATLIINTFVSIAQTGIEASVGPLFSNVALKGVNQALRPSRTLHSGVQAQVLWNQSIDGNWSVKSGVAYKEKGFVWNESINADVLNIPLKVGVSATTSMNYIEIPLHLQYKIGNENGIKAAAFIGPNIGYALNGDIRTRANMLFDFNINKTNLDLNDQIYNRFELSTNAGIGVELPIGNGSIVASANYMHGWNRVIDNTVIDFKARNYGFGASIGYKIVVGR